MRQTRCRPSRAGDAARSPEEAVVDPTRAVADAIRNAAMPDEASRLVSVHSVVWETRPQRLPGRAVSGIQFARPSMMYVREMPDRCLNGLRLR